MGTRGEIKYMLDAQIILNMNKKQSALGMQSHDLGNHVLKSKYLRSSRLSQELQHSIFTSKTSKIVSPLAACNAERIDDPLKQKRGIEVLKERPVLQMKGVAWDSENKNQYQTQDLPFKWPY